MSGAGLTEPPEMKEQPPRTGQPLPVVAPTFFLRVSGRRLKCIAPPEKRTGCARSYRVARV
jgi:hypothetical protein